MAWELYQMEQLAEIVGGRAMIEQITMTWLNHYECPKCEYAWQDYWDCQVDDDCPHCGCRHISPMESQEV